VQNLETLRARGVEIIDAQSGPLAEREDGPGRLADVLVIAERVKRHAGSRDLEGRNVLVTAGPTREPIDPVRYISNRSSGKMGYALARSGLRRGAEVTLISGPTELEPPSGARLVRVTTAEEMRHAVLDEFPRCTSVIMAAAVTDYRPVHRANKKIKRGKGPIELRLEPNPDILKELGARKDGKMLVGFAAETEELIANAEKKLTDKNLDMVVANNVTEAGGGFDVDTNVATILDRRGGRRALPLMSKDELADEILDHLIGLKSQR
jgi:phosphopantothenoylcysteine decarboxylase/phosphopantothenate--cysteine ligase